MEGDSQIITQALIRGEPQNWRLDKEIRWIRNILNAVQEFKISHILREGNMDADACANQAFELQVGDIRWEVFSPNG